MESNEDKKNGFTIFWYEKHVFLMLKTSLLLLNFCLYVSIRFKTQSVIAKEGAADVTSGCLATV